MFGAGGGTSSYREAEDADLLVLWGSNAREAHPIFFHHVLKAIHRGAKLVVVDPRRTASAQWADLWLGLDVGTDIPLANAPTGFTVTVRDIRAYTGAGWLVALCGDMQTMPGYGRAPAAHNVDIDEEGRTVGLF